MKPLRFTVNIDRKKAENPNVEFEYLEETFLQGTRVIYYHFRRLIEELRNSAIVEVDGLYQVIRIDEKESWNPGILVEEE